MGIGFLSENSLILIYSTYHLNANRIALIIDTWANITHL